MKVFKKAKKIVALFLSILAITTVFAFNSSTVIAKAATSPVELFSQYENWYYISGYLTIYVKVNTLGSNQHVYIHKNDGSTWSDVEGEYYATLSDGSQIWKVTTSNIGGGIEYAIKYVVDGNTYWDNNNGQNYTEENKLGNDPILSVTPYINIFSSQAYAGDYLINVDLKNLGFVKDVKVRYTEDNWTTYQDVPLSYMYTNLDGSERWNTDLKLDENKEANFHYAISYEVNGQTYWDNNFGNNYNYTN